MVSILDQMTNSGASEALTATISQGQNRRFYLVTMGNHDSDASGRTGVTVGGVPMALLQSGEGVTPAERAFNCFSYPAYSPSGLPDNDNTQLMVGAFYLASGANCEKHVILGNNASLDLCTDIDVVAPDSWTDTEIKLTPPSETNFTHWFVRNRNTIIDSVAI